MSQKRTINLDVNTNAEQVGNQFDNLNKSVDETAKTTNKLHQKFEDVFKDSEPLTTVLGEMEDKLYELALAGKQSTDEFAELLAEVGKYRKTQIETDLAVDQAAGTMSQKLGGALQGAASGFALVQGAMGLFGTESEEVEQALLKVNSAMALADGIRGVQEFTTSFGLASKATKSFTVVQKGLNLVLAANPFALIITAVVALIGYFATFTDAINVVIDGLKSVSDFLGITDSEAEEAAAKREQEAKAQQLALERQQKTEEAIHNAKITAIDNEIALARAQGKDTTKLQKQKIQFLIDEKKKKLASLEVDELIFKKNMQILEQLAARGGLGGKLAEGVIKSLQAQKDEFDKLKNEISKLETDLKIVDIEFEKSKSGSSSSKKQMISDLEFERKIQDLKLSQLEKTTENEIKILNVKYDRIIEDTKLNESLNEKQKTAIIIEQEKIRDNEINKIRLQSTEKLLTLETKSVEEIKPITELKLQQQKEYYDKVDEIAAKSGLKRKEVEEELKNASFSIAKDTLSLVSELNSLFASENEEQAERAFKIDKAAKLASATIAGVQATIEAFKTASASPITIGFPAYPFVQAGLAGSFAAVNIAKIAKSKFQGGGGAGELDTGGGAGGGAGASATPTAQFNVVGDSGINQLAELQNQKPTQAFVVSSEVTTAQSLYRNRVQNATL